MTRHTLGMLDVGINALALGFAALILWCMWIMLGRELLLPVLRDLQRFGAWLLAAACGRWRTWRAR